MSLVKVSQDGAVVTLTIDRPTAMNALNSEVLTELEEVIGNISCRVAIITGAGTKAFVAGADIAALAEMGPLEARAFSEMGQGVMKAISEAPFVTIAAVNGFALGGGCELAMACDLIYAAANAKLGLPETNLGLIPGFGGTFNMVKRVGWQRAAEMVLTGKMVDATAAKEMGLVLEVYSSDEFMTKVKETAQLIAKKGRHSILAARRLIKGVEGDGREQSFLLERESFASLFASPEPREGTRAFLEKREPKFNA